MAGYAIVQRVPDSMPQLRSIVRDAASNRVACARLEDTPPARLEMEDSESLRDRVAALRAAVAQTTWYLFSPDGWR